MTFQQQLSDPADAADLAAFGYAQQLRRATRRRVVRGDRMRVRAGRRRPAERANRMRCGLLVGREVSVSAFVEAGDRVHAHSNADRPFWTTNATAGWLRLWGVPASVTGNE